jgi:hypothetical protein
MSDTPPPSPPDPAVYCPACHTLIGFYVQVKDQVWLQAGGIQLSSGHGRCCQCHTEYHWCASNKLMIDLIGKPIATENPP